MTEQDPHELAQRLERETDELERQGAEVKDQVKETRADWERKRRDENVPGAPPPAQSESAENVPGAPPPAQSESADPGEADEA